MNTTEITSESRPTIGNVIAILMLWMAFGAFMTLMIIHTIDCYRSGGGVMGWMDGGHLQSMEGWQSIAMDNPHVVRGTLPGTFYVNTDIGTYCTNYSADDDLILYLEMQIAE